MNDSFGRPWRNGVVGVAIGSAGVPSLQNMIGAPDLFERPMQVTEIAIADELAAAASLVMGQGNEGQPIVHVRGFSSKAPANSASALVRPKDQDMFR
jgi:coenzyme F420-0:L-glutamate ligase/coenzyme F420-1:gamma-L-glutamate ligase